jgi:hypothetical protein
MRIKPSQLDRGKHVTASSQAPAPDWRRRNPLFSLQYTVPGFCVSDCDSEQKVAFANTLLQLGKRQRLDILQSARHGSGSEKITRKQMKVGIPAHIPEDRDFFTAVRFWGKCPMIGYVHEGVFVILWLDRNHECY